MLNARQTKIVHMPFDGFDDKLKRAKYAKINKCSEVTALRDLADLVERGIM
jgi:Fic family protein